MSKEFWYEYVTVFGIYLFICPYFLRVKWIMYVIVIDHFLLCFFFSLNVLVVGITKKGGGVEEKVEGKLCNN